MNTSPTFVVAFVLCAAAASAEQNSLSMKGMSNPDAPIEWSADNFAADANSKTGTYTGNVLIRQGEIRMRANEVRFHVIDNKPDKIYAQGHVVVDAPSGTATGDSGVYDVTPRLITLHGNVVLTKDKNVMRGSVLTVNLISGLAKLGGGGAPGERIRGLFQTQSAAAPSSTQKP